MKQEIVKITILKIALFSWILFVTWLLFTGAVFGLGEGVTAITNQKREENGLPTYTVSSQLNSSAAAKADDMCVKSYWSHVSPEGLTAWDFISASGYKYTTAGENLAKGFITDSAIVEGWLNSPGHRDNLLSQKFKETGVGSATCSNGEVIIVAHYGLSSSKIVPVSAPVPVPAPTPTPAPTKVQKQTPQPSQNIEASKVNLDISPAVPVVQETPAEPQIIQKNVNSNNIIYDLEHILATLDFILMQNRAVKPKDIFKIDLNPTYYSSERIPRMSF
jgi:hypothetical protein